MEWSFINEKSIKAHGERQWAMDWKSEKETNLPKYKATFIDGMYSDFLYVSYFTIPFMKVMLQGKNIQWLVHHVWNHNLHMIAEI